MGMKRRRQHACGYEEYSLSPTNVVGKGDFYTAPSGKVLPAWYGDAAVNGKKIAYGSPEMKQIRSKTFPGIAKAMAYYWDDLLW